MVGFQFLMRMLKTHQLAGNNNAVFAYGYTDANVSNLSNLVSTAGVVASDHM